MIHNDPLGEAFNVRVFHRVQVENLLRSQLLPVTLTPVSSTSRLRQFRITPRFVTSTVTLRNDSIQPCLGRGSPRTQATNPAVKNWMLPRKPEETVSPILGWENHANGMVNSNIRNNQQNNLENQQD